MDKPHPVTTFREAIELVAMVAFAVALLWSHAFLGSGYRPLLIGLVVVGAFAKTSYYFAESLWHLVKATALDLAYHRFLLLMAYNMAEVTLSFALDFFVLQRLNPGSLSGMENDTSMPLLLFDCFYFSVLNFSFFGYGDITPMTVPAKIVMLLEVITAFTTVIFLISDFVSMKESMRKHRTTNRT